MSENRYQGFDIANYAGANINFNIMKDAGFDTVLIECGQADTEMIDYSQIYYDIDYTNAKAACLKIGTYFFVYNNVSPEIQAQQYCNLLMNKTMDCKFILDIETGSIVGETYGGMSIDELAQSIIENMQIIFKNNGIILTDNDFVIYSSIDFATENLIESINIYNFWVANPIDSTNYMPPNDSNPNYSGNWVGWQWNFYGEVENSGIKSGAYFDFDVFLEGMYLSEPITLGVTKTQNINIGCEVEILKSATYFAPKLIPSTDKGVAYIIEDVDGAMCKLNKINEWVNYNDLKLVPTPQKNKQDSNVNSNKLWDSLDFYTKLGIFIGSFEGYIPYESNGEIGYSTNAAYWSGDYITKMQALNYAVEYVKMNQDYHFNLMEECGMNPYKLNRNQLFALYDAAYNLTAEAFQQLISTIVNDNIENPSLQDFMDFDDGGYGNLPARRKAEWEIYTKGLVTFWDDDNYYSLPSEYQKMVINGVENNEEFHVL